MARCIEVEKKIFLGSANYRHLKSVGKSRGEGTCVPERLLDTYFDNAKADLTCKDWWLRTRNGRWELKLPAGATRSERGRYAEYEEIETVAGVGEKLGICGKDEASNTQGSKGRDH